MNYHEWFRAQEEKARQERILRGVMRMLNDAHEDALHAQCPVCQGKGTIGVVFGSRDDEVRE